IFSPLSNVVFKDVAARSVTLSATGPPYVPTAVPGGIDVTSARFAQGPLIDPTSAAYGCVADARWITDAATTSGQPTVTSASAAWTSADVGRKVSVNGGVAPGTSGLVFTGKILSVAGNIATTDTNATATVAGAAALVGTDNGDLRLQSAVNYQQNNGGYIQLPPGLLACFTRIIPAPGSRLGGVQDSTRPLLMRGSGQGGTALVAGGAFTFDGLISSGQVSCKTALCVFEDFTLDGNYVGAGGVLPQPSAQSSALVGLTWPFDNAFATAGFAGLYHEFTRMRLYRPAGFGCQGTSAIKFVACSFEKMGQPDVAAGGLHWDNLGSGQGARIVLGSPWEDSSGNYADFADGTGGAGHALQFIMVGCESFNHQIGGIYACGQGSIVSFNRLRNVNAGSGIGYDAPTVPSMRSKNVVIGNVLDNLNVNNNGLSWATYGDVVAGNQAADATLGYELSQSPL